MTYSTDQLLAAAQAAAAEAEVLGKPFALCIVDAGGHVLLHMRQPGATIAAADSALSKARTAVYLGSDTGLLPPDSPMVPAFASGLPYPVNVFPGGTVLREGGAVVGAVGAGGSTDPAEDARVSAAVRRSLADAGEG